MLGTKTDYWILRMLAHGRNRATEEELDREGCSSLTPEQMGAKLPRVLDRFEGHLPLSPDLHYLDMGCGSGELTLGLAQHGAKHIVGVDYLPRFVELARRNATRASIHADIRFECADLHTWQPPRKFDVVVSFDALEHIDQPGEFLVTMSRFLAPGGKAVLSFGPLFHSPHGYHLYWACQVPYAHLLFGLDAIAAMRADRGGSLKQPASWREMGLNGLRFRDYAASVERAGFEIVRFRPIPVKGLTRLAAAPLIGDLFIFGVDCHIRRPR